MPQARDVWERFWEKVDISLERDACWIWRGTRDRKGYGRFTIGSKTLGTKKTILVHRMAWILCYGEIEGTLCVLHSCDNPPCCNPSHLWLGSIADNNADMIRKGRDRKASGDASGHGTKPWAYTKKITGDNHWTRKHPEIVSRGSSHGNAKLDEQKVIFIREKYAKGEMTHKELSKTFGVDSSLIGLVVNRKIWKHI